MGDNKEGLFEDIMAQLLEKAHSYTPEWRMDMEQPDIGTALACVYAGMMEGTLRRFLKIPLKNRIAFLNELDAGLLPALPSGGYTAFSLVNDEVGGVEVPRGTQVLSDADDSPDGQLSFETQEDVYVTPAAVTKIYQTCDRYDQIFCHYDKESGQEPAPFSLFSSGHGNLQRHELYFSHELVFDISTEGYIAVELFAQGELPVPHEMAQMLANPAYALFEYSTEDGFVPFSRVRLTHEGLVFFKEKEQPAFAKALVGSTESFWIRCRIRQYEPFAKLRIGRMLLSGWNGGVAPQTIYGGDEECSPNEYLPFGEQLSPYQTVYFGSGEVLSKKGATVTFSFGIDFVKIPLDTTSQQINWEWIMRRSDFKPDLEYDVTIESVIWEYYNGAGWTRLFADGSFADIFSTEHGTMGQYQSMEFVCPDDIEPVLINAVQTFYIRARILKVNNLYKQNGSYIMPLLGNTTFSYHYRDNRQPVAQLVWNNNLDMQEKSGRMLYGNEPLVPFVQTGEEGMCLYIGYAPAPVGSPVRMLFETGDTTDRSGEPLLWEYWNGRRWRNLNMVDGTEHFSRTGIVSFSGSPDFAKKRLFGTACYWIRLRDIAGSYLARERKKELPYISRLSMNTTRIRQIGGREREFFQMELYQESAQFTLQHADIYEINVYVEESAQLSDAQQEELFRQNRLWREQDDAGVVLRTWVRWDEVEDFVDSAPSDRHYTLNRAAGTLTFGDGRHGKIPHMAREDNLCVDYCYGGGAQANLKEGMVRRMNQSIGFISGVANPMPLGGGCDRETLAEALARNSAKLRHHNRAVAPRDFEELALLACRDIGMVKCFPGFDDKGMPQAGAVTLVVMPKQRPVKTGSFAGMKAQIMDYMSARMSMTLADSGRFYIVEPQYVELRIHMEVTVHDFNEVFSVKTEILDRLEQFLSPADKDGTNGWVIGTFPNTLQIRNAVRTVGGIVNLKSLMLGAYVNHGNRQMETDMDAVKNMRYVLPLSGAHEIVIGVE